MIFSKIAKNFTHRATQSIQGTAQKRENSCAVGKLHGRSTSLSNQILIDQVDPFFSSPVKAVIATPYTKK